MLCFYLLLANYKYFSFKHHHSFFTSPTANGRDGEAASSYFTFAMASKPLENDGQDKREAAQHDTHALNSIFANRKSRDTSGIHL